MNAIIKLHTKENTRNNIFLMFGILGSLVTLFIFFNVEINTVDSGVTTDYVIYGFQWKVLSVIAALGSIALSMNTISRHRDENRGELIRIHGLSYEKQNLALVGGNIVVGVLMSLVLCIGMFIQILVKGIDSSFINILLGILFYILSVVTSTLLISLLTLVLPASISALLSIGLVGLGVVRSLLLVKSGNKEGIIGIVSKIFMKLVPPIDGLGEISRDLFLGEIININKMFSILLYIWLLLGVIYLINKVVTRNEK